MYKINGETIDAFIPQKTYYNNCVTSNRLIFEVFLISNNDMFLKIITTPTSSNTRTSELVCNGTVTSLNLNVGSADGDMVSFYHLDDMGKNWNVVYELYKQTGLTSQLYILRLEDTFYTVADGAQRWN